MPWKVVSVSQTFMYRFQGSSYIFCTLRKSCSALKPFQDIQLRKDVILGKRDFSNLYHPHLGSAFTFSGYITSTAGFFSTYFLGGGSLDANSLSSTGKTRKFSQLSIQKYSGRSRSLIPYKFTIFLATAGVTMKYPVPIPFPFSSQSMTALAMPAACAEQALSSSSFLVRQGRFLMYTLNSCSGGYAYKLCRLWAIASSSFTLRSSSSDQSEYSPGLPNSASKGSSLQLSSSSSGCQSSPCDLEPDSDSSSSSSGGSSGSP